MSKKNKEELKLVKMVVDVVISANHTIFKIEQLKHQNQYWLKEIKNYGNLFLKRLMKIEGHFDELADNENTIATFNAFEDYMKEVRSTELSEMQEVTEILKASKKDRMMMLSMAKTINET